MSVVEGKPLLPRVAPGRVEAKFDFHPDRVPSRPGAKGWIWLADSKRPVAALFRKEFNLPSRPGKAQVWFSADAHARIYVNGHLAARGPDDGGQDYPGTQTGRWFTNYRDLTSLFRKGKNTIAAEVFTADAMAGRYNSTGHGGFLFEAKLQLGHQELTIGTDRTWRGIPGKEWRFADWKPGSGSLQFDAAAEIPAWRETGYDDKDWPSCATAQGWPKEEISRIPPRLEVSYPVQTVLRPTATVRISGKQISFLGDGSCAVRFDRNLSGFIGLKVRGKAGQLLIIQPSEPNAPGYNRMATIKLRDGVQTVELPFYDSFSTINLTATHVLEPLEILDVRANFVAQPVSYDGAFACSDEKLTQIWKASRWLTELGQQTHHLDSPHHQEPICDPGDYLIISLNNYSAFGRPYLARQDLRKYAWLLRATKFRPFHTSYALLWLQMLMAYTDYTGDKTLAEELTPEVHALLEQFATYRGKNGLLSEAPDYMFMDWVNIAGFEAHHPPAVIGQGYMTAFYYRALADGIRVAGFAGDRALATKYAAMREEIRAAYNRELWDEKAGLYRDGKPFVTSVKPGDWLPADKDVETHSTQNNVLAVLYDLAPARNQAPILRQLLKGDLNTQPYYMYFVFEALEHAGLFEEFGVAQMHRWKIQPDTQTFREMWNTGDYSHSWECSPLYEMSTRILGISPSSPGFDRVRIHPETCGLSWAKGTMPTPHGPVSVSWTRSAGEFRLTVEVPPGTTADLELPASRFTLDGREVGQAVNLTAGKHEAIVRTN